jgi:hypothetical protein
VYIQGDAVKAPTSTAITSIAPTPVNVNEPVMLGFAVLPQTGLAVPPSGTVTVKASTGESCFGFAPAGFCAITFTTAADRTLTAEYTGDSHFTGSISPGVTINMPDFHLQVLPSSQTVTGEKATYTVTITPLNEFTGNVSLRCAGGPAHATCDVSPAVVSVRGSAASARATVAVPKQAKPGTYTVTITGHSGATTRSSPASLTVK